MPLFMTIHRAPGLSREEFQQNAPDVLESKHARMLHVWVNMYEGFIVTLYDGENAEAVESEFERIGFPFEEIHEMQLDVSREQLEKMVASGGGGGAAAGH
ncbi:MAG: DUF4242 domain-containing protein [Candidatus Dormibacteraeota bacterium]|nr:DUF4242 domain-containing protein [Candidatus Dormibacteraeota bacterium]MBV9524599.1 DUF4242 domain-containing protein [Candidatus Dormibacteraeota bacterium]